MAEVCRSCKAPVRWIRMVATGRPNPLNPDPDYAHGNVHIMGADAGEHEGKGIVVTGHALEEARAARKPLYLSHFATCEFAKEHRRG